MLAFTGKQEAALKEIDVALSVDPLSLIINENKAEHLINAGRYEEAISQFKHTLELDSTFSVAYPYFAVAYSMIGDHANAVRSAERTLARPEFTYDMGQAAFALVRAGQTRRAHDVLNNLERRSLWATTAAGYLALEDTARALANLEKQFESGAHQHLYEPLSVSPGTVAIRNHPRVKALRRKLGLEY
jgi:tetratricopeptide (TPR) repeat protein